LPDVKRRCPEVPTTSEGKILKWLLRKNLKTSVAEDFEGLDCNMLSQQFLGKDNS
jgi:hypothetical protein